MECLPCQQAKKALKAVNDITNGYTNLAKSVIVPNSATETLAEERMKVCSTCDFKVPLVKIANKQYYNCSKCHCPLDASTRSTGYSCPIGKL